MERNTILTKVKMDTLNADLVLLENLSKKISDLVYNNQYSAIAEIDKQRQTIIKKIKENTSHKKLIKERVGQLIENNIAMVKDTEKRLSKLRKNHFKFNNRIKAYSSNKI